MPEREGFVGCRNCSSPASLVAAPSTPEMGRQGVVVQLTPSQPSGSAINPIGGGGGSVVVRLTASRPAQSVIIPISGGGGRLGLTAVLQKCFHFTPPGGVGEAGIGVGGRVWGSYL
jgi:hypothetical protein